ncbi:hypothetical protein KUTeg_005993 [Tegillarca granosa]|uniref:SGNH hydrolase-type esterase domain-containing protein n=1 Tax=Tegillarca granosa TaxID=220873 RepID=A0ABQ9FF99_TEGGR|nr:hypothetical protein KUTeg_005993 [Tegillarca granosa]
MHAVPVPVEDVVGDGRWMSQHQRFLIQAKGREPEVVFIGDSIIQLMRFSSHYKSFLEPMHCLNFGIGSDQTQHVLWRIINGELDCVQPKVIVLEVGTNNHDHSADQVVGGIMEIVRVTQDKQPSAQLIVMGIPPRGEKPNPVREKIATINKDLLKKLSGTPNVTFINIEPSMFINEDGLISHKDMYDYLHMTDDGYKKFCEPLQEEIQNLSQNFIKVENISQDMQSINEVLASDTP